MSRALKSPARPRGASRRKKRAPREVFVLELRWACLASFFHPGARPGAECEVLLRCRIIGDDVEANGVVAHVLLDGSEHAAFRGQRLHGHRRRMRGWRTFRLSSPAGWHLEFCLRGDGRSGPRYVRCDLPRHLGLPGGRYGVVRASVNPLRAARFPHAPLRREGRSAADPPATSASCEFPLAGETLTT